MVLSMIQKLSVKVRNGSQKIHHKQKKYEKFHQKSILITFFDSKGIIHKEFVPTGQTITGAYYLEVLSDWWTEFIIFALNIVIQKIGLCW